MIKKVLKSGLTMAITLMIGLGAITIAGSLPNNASYAKAKPASFYANQLYSVTGGWDAMKYHKKINKIIFTDKVPNYVKKYKLYPKIRTNKYGQIYFTPAKKGVKYKIYTDMNQKGRIIAWVKNKNLYIAGNNRSLRMTGAIVTQFDKNNHPDDMSTFRDGPNGIYVGKLESVRLKNVIFDSNAGVGAFEGMRVKNIDLRGSKLKNIRSTSNMFSYCTAKKIIFPKKWTMKQNATYDFSKEFKKEYPSTFYGMFEGCKNLKTVDLSGYYGNIDNVYKMLETFSTKVTAKIPGGKTVVYDGKNNKVMKEYQTKK